MHLGSSQTCLERKSSLKALSLVRHPINDSNIYSHSEAIKVGFCRGGGQVVKHPLQNYHWMVILERGLCLSCVTFSIL